MFGAVARKIPVEPVNPGVTALAFEAENAQPKTVTTDTEHGEGNLAKPQISPQEVQSAVDLAHLNALGHHFGKRCSNAVSKKAYRSPNCSEYEKPIRQLP
jgi:hypothetical protein